ncbi:MAG: penicillin acylase family protein [Firmicutes bacterium]|nr:penicillin acylase family protein [Bacillota bacterium]
MKSNRIKGSNKNIWSRILKLTLLIMLVVIVLVSTTGIWLITKPWPKTNGKLQVEGLESSVTIYRDKLGIPQIYAENEHDLFFSQGYVQAQDRLFQMEVNRRVGNGTLSEMVGYPGLGMDKLFRVFGMRRVAEKTWPLLDDETRMIVEAYCEGINAYINTYPGKLPMEFLLLGAKPRRWEPLDVLSYGNTIAFINGLNYSYEMFRAQLIAKLGEKRASEALPVWDNDNPLVIPPELNKYMWLKNDKIAGISNLNNILPGTEAFGWASGAWVISGKYTDSGKPLLAGDAHMSIGIPSLWQEIGLHGGRFDVVGFSLPGTPMVVIGHNQRIAWSFTNMNPDVQDLYVEKFDDRDNPTKYEYMGKWRELERVEEVIKVKGNPDVKLEVLFTHHGPVLNDLVKVTDQDLEDQKNFDQAWGYWPPLRREKWANTEPIALRWAFFDRCVILKCVKELNLAQNWDQFRSALSQWDSLSQNFVYGDIDGNIGYQAAAKIPIRVAKHQGAVPVPGWTGEYEWKGFIPFEKLPSMYNPPTGYLAVVNSKTVDDSYPYQLTYDWFHPGYRGRAVKNMIEELIAKGDPLTKEDMGNILGDNLSYGDALIRPYLAAVKPATELEAEALEYIKKWDNRYDLDSVGAAIYKVWYTYMDRNVYDDELEKEMVWGFFPPLKRLLSLINLIPDQNNSWFDNVNTPEIETRDQLISKSLTEAVDWLAQEYGNNVEQWTLGRIQKSRLNHQILGNIPYLKNIFNSRGNYPFSGSHTAVAFAFSFCTPPGKLNIGFASSQRNIFDVGNWDEAWTVNSTGVSEHVFHPHREDQMKMWASIKFHELPFSNQAVEKSANRTLHLEPKNN